MKIILVAPKSITGHKQSMSPFRFDYAYWNFYLPMQSLGHQVHFCDTSIAGDKELSDLIEKIKPDLIFGIMTGDVNYCPQEPWETIQRETESGRTFTFNWFCDDAWRFDNFSSKKCHFFNAVVTTDDPLDVNKYKEIGYDNALYATWHANSQAYSGLNSLKDSDVAFVGNLHGDRGAIFNLLKEKGIKINHFSNVSFEDMIWNYSRSLIGLNLSTNSNDKNGKLILKARPFEITAVGSLLLTQEAVGLEECFQVDKEIITFTSFSELLEKSKFLLDRPKLIKTIAARGHKRFKEEHDSCVRLGKLLNKLKELQ